MIGEVRLFPFEREPEGHYLCDGRELDVSKYTQLFALIGYKFGGDGRNHFRIPAISQSPLDGLHWYIHAFDDDFPQFD